MGKKNGDQGWVCVIFGAFKHAVLISMSFGINKYFMNIYGFLNEVRLQFSLSFKTMQNCLIVYFRYLLI